METTKNLIEQMSSSGMSKTGMFGGRQSNMTLNEREKLFLASAREHAESPDYLNVGQSYVAHQ